MGIDIDHYEYKTTVLDHPEDDVLEYLTTRPQKTAVLIDTSDPQIPEELREALKGAGIGPDVTVTVIIDF